MYIYMYMYVCMRMYMYMYPCIYVCVCVCICIYIYVYACMRVYVYMYICTKRGSWGIFGDSSVTLAQWWRARHLRNLVIRRSPVQLRPKTRQLRFTWIWASRPSSKGSKLLFPVIKAISIKCVCIYTSPYAFLQRVGMHPQVLLNTMHVQVCTLDRCCEHQRTHLLHARYRMCICYIYIHVYMHICMYIFICMHVYIYKIWRQSANHCHSLRWELKIAPWEF